MGKITCKDGQEYRQRAEKFFEAVDEASVAVEDGKEELERIERERAEREHWIDRLDDLKVELDSKPNLLKARMEKIITVDNDDGNIYKRLDDILCEVMPKMKEIPTMVKKKEAASKAAFESRKALFQGK